MGPSTLIPTRRSGSGIGGPGPSLSQALAWGVLPRSPPARHPRRFRWALHAPEPVSSSGERENIERQARNSPFVGSRWGHHLNHAYLALNNFNPLPYRYAVQPGSITGEMRPRP